MVTTVTNNSPQAINTSLFSLEREIEALKQNIERIKASLGDLDTGVVSVNGKQGIVTINAQDVHALPDTTVIPTTTGELVNNSDFITSADVAASYVPLTRKVNNKELDTDITLTASDVGALPDSTVVPTVVDTVASGNMNAVTSNAVAGYKPAQADYADSADNGRFGMLGGASGPSARTLQELWQVLCGGNGKGGICGGSLQFTDGDGWRNFLYIPHRTGVGGDNMSYGTLITFPMIGQNTNIYFYRNGGGSFVHYKTI